jgi:hypothetical protein
MHKRQILTRSASVAITVTAAVACGLIAPSAAQAAPVSVDCVSAPTTALQDAIAAASDGDELDITGTCVGQFEVPSGFYTLGLTFKGVSKGATLDGDDAGTTLDMPYNSKITIEDLTITGGHGDAGLPGVLGAAPTIGFAGGISSGADLTLSHVTVSGNVGGIGGAGKPDIAGGPAAQGGPGAVMNYGFLTIMNSTISGNTGGVGGAGGPAATTGGDGGTGGTGGLHDSLTSGVVTVTASTISGNAAGAGGVGGTGATPGATGVEGVGGIVLPNHVTLTGSVLADNDPGGISDCAEAVSSGGYNVIGSTTGCTFSASTADQTGTSAAPLDAKLSTLTYHDGFTKTMGLGAGSPAIGLIPVASGVCPADDQRDVARPQGTNCDAGALEVAATSITIHAPKSVTAGSKAKIRGALTSATTSCESGRTVTLVKGASAVKTQQTTVAGAYSFKLTIKKLATVHVEFAGNPACAASASKNKTIRLG